MRWLLGVTLAVLVVLSGCVDSADTPPPAKRSKSGASANIAGALPTGAAAGTVAATTSGAPAASGNSLNHAGSGSSISSSAAPASSPTSSGSPDTPPASSAAASTAKPPTVAPKAATAADLAQAAHADLATALGPDGDLQSASMDLHSKLAFPVSNTTSTMEFTVHIDITYDAAGGSDTMVSYKSFLMDGKAMPELQGVSFHLVCTTAKLTITINGIKDKNGNAQPFTTTMDNPVKTCRPSDADKTKLAAVEKTAKTGGVAADATLLHPDLLGPETLPPAVKVDQVGDKITGLYSSASSAASLNVTQVSQGGRVQTLATQTDVGANFHADSAVSYKYAAKS